MFRRYLAAGLASEAIYLAAVLGPFALLAHGTELTDLGRLTDYGPIAAILVTAGLVTLFALYGWALQGMRDDNSRILPIVLGGTALFSFTLVLLYPAMAIDVYSYAVQGHAAAFYHVNPLVTPSVVAGDDVFMTYAGTWAQSPSPYGPVWIDFSQLVALIAGSNVVLAIFLLKLLAAFAVIGTTFLLAIALGDRGPRAKTLAAICFGWNPLVQIELVGNGHNDAVLTFLLVGGLVLLAKNRTMLGVLGIGGAVLIKILPIGVVPLCLLAVAMRREGSFKQKLVSLIASTAVLVALAVVAYAPYWNGLTTLRRLLAADNDYVGSIPAFAFILDPAAVPSLIYPRMLIAAGIGLWQIRSLGLGRASLPQAAFEVIFGTVLLASHFAGWYLALLVALSVLSEDRHRQGRALMFTLTAALTIPTWAYVWWWTKDIVTNSQFHLILVPLTFIPVLVLTMPLGGKLVDGLVQKGKAAWLSHPRAGLHDGAAKEVSTPGTILAPDF